MGKQVAVDEQVRVGKQDEQVSMGKQVRVVSSVMLK